MRYELSWDKGAWEDYVHWQTDNEKLWKKINLLIKDTLRSPTQGIGKPERLKGDLNVFYSRRIDKEHRLVYRIYPTRIHIIQCRFHY